MRWGGQRIAPTSRWLIPLIIVFAALTWARAEPLTVLLSALLTLLLMAVLAVTYAGGRWLQYGILDYALNFLQLARSMVARPLALLSEAGRHDEPGSQRSRGPNLWPVVRGVAIALPVLFVFGALLASADLVFGRELTAILRSLQLERLPEYIFRLLYILLAAYALAGVYLHAALQSSDGKLMADGKPLIPPFLGLTEAGIVLGSVSVLFAAFVMVQFNYFFGGEQNIGLEGYTYSEYARRGFGELVAVAVLSLILILGLGAVTDRATRRQRRIFSSLSTVVVVLVAVILVSAYQRLNLYELAYGFTRLRTYTHVFLIWVGLLLAVVALLEWMHRERIFAAAALLAALGFALSLAFLNVDGFIVHQNVQRSGQGQALDVPYLVSLSTDADPVLAKVFGVGGVPSTVREAVGAALACRSEFSSVHARADWRSFTFSRWQSDKAIQGVRQGLNDYRPADGQSPLRIVAPNGMVYSCVGPPD